MKKAVIFIEKSLILVYFLLTFTLFGCNFQANTNTYEYVDMTPRQISVSSNVDTVTLVENVKSAVVGISCAVSGGYSIGSGVAIRDGGYILTNQHVVSGAKSITIYFADKTSTQAKLLWQNLAQDLAIVKSSVNMPYLVTASDMPSVGEDVVAIGTPLSLDFGHTVTKGIVSALNRTVEVENSNKTVTYMQNLIQHDASINPGNSGGPIINSRGEVVGINTLKASDAEGIAFAIPISLGKSAVDKVKADGDFKTAYMGIFTLDRDVAKFMGENVSCGRGVYVSAIDENCESKNYFKRGDIIVKINGDDVNSVLDLRLLTFKYKSGDILNIKLIRDNREIELRYNMQER